MSTKIPLRSDLPHFDLQAELDGTVYTLELRWNVRDEAWYLDVLDETSETNLWSAKAVVNFPIGSHVPDRQPPGALVFVDTSGQNAEAGIHDLGERVQLLYFSAAELGL